MLHEAILSKSSSHVLHQTSQRVQQQSLQYVCVVTTSSGRAMKAANKRCMTSVRCSRTFKGLKYVLNENITPSHSGNLVATYIHTHVWIHMMQNLYMSMYMYSQVYVYIFVHVVCIETVTPLSVPAYCKCGSLQQTGSIQAYKSVWPVVHSGGRGGRQHFWQWWALPLPPLECALHLQTATQPQAMWGYLRSRCCGHCNCWLELKRSLLL